MVSKKVPKRSNPKIRKLQAEYMFTTHNRISEGMIIDKALDDSLEMKGIRNAHGNKGHSLMELSGIFKLGKNASREIDDVVYG